VQVTNEGKAILHRERALETDREPQLAHDLSKKLLLPANKADSFLQATGIMDEQGRVRPSMQGKFSQINEFLKLLDHTGELERFEKTPINILDCGCGSAYLSFAAYHYLNDVRGIPARLEGIDTNETLIQKDNLQSEQLGFSNACFQKSAIINYVPQEPPDIVLALHACDTATDEAIFQGIVSQSRLVMCAPCCHHHLQQQLHAVKPFTPIFHDGILKQRMADILTDTFRALVLRIMGYKTDVVEFISTEHTDKNLMIRAVKRAQPGKARYIQEYLDLKKYWGVTPHIETLLGDQFTLSPPQFSRNSRT
jgi:SAM-dependent methyltransferase